MKKLIVLAALVAAPLASHAQDAQKLTFDFSGWFVWNSFRNDGEFDGRELPRFTTVDPTQEGAYGMTVRQSRLRLNVGIPTDNWLAGGTLKGFVEADFMGGAPAPTGEVSTVLPRLRHAYVQATWKQLANLNLLVGQSWGIAPGPYFASSLTHLAVPRFAGAGFLYRRAPEVKAWIDTPVAGDFSLLFSAGVLTPGDFSSSLSGSAGNISGAPNFEGRIGGAFRPGGKQMAEVGLWAHRGSEKYELTTGAGFAPPVAGTDDTTNSQGFGVDVKFDLPHVSLLGGAFQGENLDVLTSIAGQRTTGTGALAAGGDTRTGVVIDPTTGQVYNIETEGAWAQLVVTPVKGFQVVAGAGFENPQDSTLALPGATSLPANVILRNTQYSGGVILNVTSKWRISAEYTRYITKTAQPTQNDTFTGNQFEFGSLLAL